MGGNMKSRENSIWSSRWRGPFLSLFFLAMCLTFATSPAHADRFKALAEIFAKVADDEAKIASKAARAEQGLADSAWVADALKAEAQVQADLIPLAADEAGQFVVGTTGKAVRSTQDLAMHVGRTGRETRIIVRKSDAFAHSDDLQNLTGDAEFLIIDTGTGTVRRARFERLGDGTRVLRVEARSGIWIDSASEDALRLGLDMLDHATPVQRVDLLSFFDASDVRVAKGFDAAAGASHKALNGADADKMVKMVGEGRNRVIMIVSHVEDGKAVVRTPAGEVAGSVPLDALQAAADASDNTLVFLGCSTSRSPVGGFISPVRTDPIIQSVKSVWKDGQLVFGDLLSRLGQQGGGFVVNAAQAQSLRRSMLVQPLDTSGYGAGGLVLSRAVVNQLPSDREFEYESRLIPFIPSSVQLIVIFSSLMLLFGVKEPWRSWVSVTGPAREKLPAPISRASQLIGFAIFGVVWVAIVRVGSKLYKFFALMTGASWAVLLFTSIQGFIFTLLSIAMFAGVYLGLFADREPPGLWERTKSVVILTALFGVLNYALIALFFLPFLIFEVNWIWSYLVVGTAAAILTVWLLIRIFRNTRDRPADICERLWSDPFWPFRQIRPAIDQEVAKA